MLHTTQSVTRSQQMGTAIRTGSKYIWLL